MHSIQIDSEFQALIPPLSAEERAQLEANLLADGCRDPLVVWPLPAPAPGEHKCYAHDESKCDLVAEDDVWHCRHCEHNPAQQEYVLIDGHNRHEICTRLGLPFEVVAQEFDSRAHARIWMRANQAGRRNLPDAWKIDLQLGNKDDLAAIGAAKYKATVGRPSAEIAIQMDNDLPKHNTQKEIAKAADVGVGTVARAEIVKRKAPDLWEKAKAQEITIGAAYTQVKRAEKEEKREERREENRAKVAEVVAPAQIVEAGARFATIVIDPPWDWGDEGDQDQLGRARPDYATMSMAQLLDLPVADMSDEDCHIYLWITNRSLPKGFELLERWGFRYITALTWAKPHFGMGNYFRGQTEHVLFGVRGSQPLKRKDVGTVFHAPRGPAGHSSKPPEIYDLVESCSPGPYLEMFSRSQRADWTSWGENANARA